jgi:hypothetical protein
LDFFHLKDYRIKQGRPSAKVLVAKLFQRFLLACLLSTICIPGLVLWAPVFLAVKYVFTFIWSKPSAFWKVELDAYTTFFLLIP